MTPADITKQLTDAKWTPEKREGSNWINPVNGHCHSWPVALIVADLPRATAPGPSAAKVARLVHLMAVRKVGLARTAKEVGLDVDTVRKIYEKHKKQASVIPPPAPHRV